MADDKLSRIDEDVEVELSHAELENQNPRAIMQRAEIDVQISTAHAYPRSIEKFLRKATAMLMTNPETAAECFYTLPRAGKAIQGPSVRLAEIVEAAYGNIRSGGRVIGEDEKFVTAQGVCHDLENNVAVTFEVRRRITDKNGVRFGDDMIGTTSNAAISIAFRNSVFRVVPKVLWSPLYEKARKVARGDEKTLDVRREGLLVAFERSGISRKTVFKYIGVEGISEISLDHLETLIGIGNAIKQGEITPEAAFGEETAAKPAVKETKRLAGKPAGAANNSKGHPTDQEPAPQEQAATPDSVDSEAIPGPEKASKADIKQFWSDCMVKLGFAQVDVKKFVRENFNMESLEGVTKETLASIYSDLAQSKP